MAPLPLPRLLLCAATAAAASAAVLEPAAKKQAKCRPQAQWPDVPKFALEHNGISWPELCYEGDDEEHVFVIGDYGGITCGHRSAKTHWRDPNGWACHSRRKGVYAMSADNTKDHPGRGRSMIRGIDDHPQWSVAQMMKRYAPKMKPRYVLNGGDNFYFGGLDTHCGVPMDVIDERTRVQFEAIFENMYSGEGMDVPWFSTLGNHDFGGRVFTAAWDQQIAYTWASNTSRRWILPGLYWHQRVTYPDKNFTVDYYMLDTNKGDAKPWTHDKNHNICGGFNTPQASCRKAGGPTDRYSCHQWFDKLWNQQKQWLDEKLASSDADWQILTTHFPPDQFMGGYYWKNLIAKYGVDLFVGSHRHMQELHMNDGRFNRLNWIVVGGGGGITSEWNPGYDWRGRRQYGFMDLQLTKTQITIKSINYVGDIIETATIEPRPAQGEPTCAHYGCGGNANEQWWQLCQCTEDCWKFPHWSPKKCCSDFSQECPKLASCETYGCGSYVRGRPCQCNRGCSERGDCCSDYNGTCNTREIRAAEASCDSGCVIKDQNFSCKARIEYAMSHQHRRKQEAIDGVNEECAGQCNCTSQVIAEPHRWHRAETMEDDGPQVQEAVFGDNEVIETDDAEDNLEEITVDENREKLLKRREELVNELHGLEDQLPEDKKAASGPVRTQDVWGNLKDLA
eukprot:TRINITY_DN53996_c0_g1_i1.p1 TRINITY_DN53996_c0_g1~~TRINITY_DN53996_c0_g1_i1.p1  ORF type:complete len:678 (+),score=162.60 TRINITY_DN53996_c0_g1_i1:185-2218(+)